MRLSHLVALSLVTSLLAARPAEAGEPNSPIAWGVTTGELGMFGVFAANFNNVWPNHGPALALNMTPIALGVGAALGAHYGHFDARPALAVHGAGWMGLEGFLIGALIDGRDKSWGLHAGKVAWTLGAVGALTGGLLGALEVNGASEGGVWLAAPPAGFVGGGIVIGGLLVLIGGIDGDAAPGQFATGALVGLGLGLGAASILSIRGFDDTAPARITPTVSNAALSDERATIFSFGGAF